MAIVKDMIPAFDLVQPASIEDALEILADNGEEAWVLAGGLCLLYTSPSPRD